MSRALRAAIYRGELAHAAPNVASEALVSHVWELLEAHLGPAPRAAHLRLESAVLLARLAAVRAALHGSLDRCREAMRAAGLAPEEHAMDVPRLRAVVPGAHRVAAAAPVYLAHRDTWYANPRAQINLWIPLHDVPPAHGFTIYPRCFATPVANDSARFDYDAWRRDVGWQRAHAPPDAAYPGAAPGFDERDAICVSGSRASTTLFSAAHLHQTRAFEGGAIRFSVDFRVVHVADHEAGLGAPSVDDASRGSTFADLSAPERA